MQTSETNGSGLAFERLLDGKRERLVEDYGIAGLPAIILQCVPDEPLRIGAKLADLAALRKRNFSGNVYWWSDFISYKSADLVFDGLSWSNTEGAKWCLEFHEDGHVLAGVWAFPESNRHQSGTGVVREFYTQVFYDFAAATVELLEAVGYSGERRVTCSFLNADVLSMSYDSGYEVKKPPKRKDLHWPVRTIASSEDEKKVCDEMAIQLMRAYGLKWEPSKPSAKPA